MSENQIIEYKQGWRDEYLKWICGFANANGGTIFIGKDDNGKIVGLKDAKKLLEDIPNKVRDILGIVVDVNLHETKEGNYIEIKIDPYPNPVNYKGQYHYRTGSTKQELKGSALDNFLLRKYGKSWDSVPILNVAIENLNQKTIELFKTQGIRSKRLNDKSINDTARQLLENLKLIEENNLLRACLLLFHNDPEKFITGSYIKIGYFENNIDLIFQDEIHGSLFEQIEKTIDLLFTKYIKAIISYEDQLRRVETYEYPKDAIREALLNAIAHKDYSGLTPIQIRVYSNKIMIWNQGRLPDDWEIADLLKEHSSRPHNPNIANALFRSGYIESWGRGISKMTELCLENKQPQPVFDVKGSDFWVIFRKDIYNEEYLSKLGLNERQLEAMLVFKKKGEIVSSEYRQKFEIAERTARYDLIGLVEKGLLIKQGSKKATKYIFADKLPLNQ